MVFCGLFRERDSLKDLLRFIQFLNKTEIKPNLYFITHGIQPIGRITDLDHATFNGFYSTLKLEMHDLNCRHIDLAPDEKFPIEELFAADKEDQVAYRQGIRYIIRLVPKKHFEEFKENPFKIDPAGSYLVTGGLGGIGGKVAEWLAKQGAKHLVLAGRNISKKVDIPNAIIEKIAIDVSQKPAVEALMKKFGKEWPELKGIIHSAGILGESENYLKSQEWTEFEKVFASKVQGSWYLHEASLEKPLDFFVLFSSISSLLGFPKACPYTSANAYMNALAHFRKERGLPALAINWGIWKEVGMLGTSIKGRLAGQEGLNPDEAVKALGLALTQTNPELIIVDMEWNIYPHKQNVLSELTISPVTCKENPIFLQRLSEALSSERKDILVAYLQDVLFKILKTASLDLELGFFEAGMDSIMSEELYEKLQSDIGSLHQFPATIAFDYPSILKLTKYFEEHVFPLIGIKADIQKVETVKDVVNIEEIAIIGLSCRFPGGANQPQTFWELLKQGYDGISEIPSNRWDVDAFYDPDPEVPGKMYARHGGFLNTRIDTFDAQFFGISPREADYMDPQQRLLLEVAWEALENACIDPLSLKGSKTGVFLGLCSHDFPSLIDSLDSMEDINLYVNTGSASSILSGRLSYFLGLQGPSMTVDTACSSSLFSIHSACNSLQNGESQLALAGGVNIILNPRTLISECKAHMIAKDGYCKTFDSAADGFVRGEGCGIIVLKRLSAAMRDQDPILGIIKATTTNQDGASSGLTVPNKDSQVDLISSALLRAGLDPNDIDYIEAHGTGTPLGDPIEIGALSTVFNGRKEHPLWIGTVKTNIGHLEGASGVAGVIKTVLSLNHEAIPLHLHFKQLNPRISLDSIPAKIPLSLTPWSRSNRPRIAGVNSFGFSGTNVHVIIEEPPLIEHKKNAIDRPFHLLTLSAKSQGALQQLIDLYKTQLPNEELADIAFTTNNCRAHFIYRIALISQNRDELLQLLQTDDYLIGQASQKPPKITFVFTGQPTDNINFIESSPSFKEAMERSKGLYEYALFELWKSWGVVPDYVVGEGQGDILAAIAAGIISLEEGLKLIDVRDNPDELKKVANEIQYREPQIGFISSWTGQVVRKESLTADYWNLHENIKHIPEDTLVIFTQNNWKDLLQTLSQLYLNGILIDWKAFDKPYNRKKVSLPTYPFQRESYWVEALKTKQTENKPASWFYEIEWQRKPLEPTEGMLKKTWLVVARREVEIEGLEFKTVKPEGAVAELTTNPPTGVLWFASGEDSLKYALKFVQALNQLETKPSLYFITHGIQFLGPIADLDHATFNGFFRTLKLEMPTLDSHHIDILFDEKLPLQELLASDEEFQVAYRQGIRYVARLVHKEPKKDAKELKIDPTGSYLITGGLGGLGKQVAAWLAKKGAKHLVLVGRNASSNVSIANATVVTAAMDIADNSSIQDLIEKFGKEWPELKGIIHAAGIIDDGVITVSKLEWI